MQRIEFLCGLILYLFCLLGRVSAQTELVSIVNDTTITVFPNITIYYDPPENTVCPTALGIYVWSNYPSAKIYYETNFEQTFHYPDLNSSYADSAHPYIQMDTPFKASRNRTLILVAVYTDDEGKLYRSNQITIRYYIEASARPKSFAYLVPGVESGGYFLQVELEVAATARAQAAGSQEFADFFSDLGYGTYASQVQALDLRSIDPDLNGFEGGFTYNQTHNGPFYGILIPYYSGQEFFGKLVRVNLWGMSSAGNCSLHYLIERMVNGVIQRTGTVSNPVDACVYILDLQSLDSRARGFRRGFLGYPYGYLSPGTDQVAVRINLLDLQLSTTRIIDLSTINPQYGGYSGGFQDGTWSCFTPYRTYVGEFGGLRSTLAVDANNLHPYYSSIMICLEAAAWNPALTATERSLYFREIDFSLIELNLRGFSDAIRVGRYAYLSPLTHSENVYSSKMIRINLGMIDIGNAIDTANAMNNIRGIIDVLDLSQVNPNLAGYSSLFTAGQYLFLSPYRNSYIPSNGQRGHGFVIRLNMNSFNQYGVEFLDLTVTTRNQIPSFFDTNLRGFSFGFASGQYAIFVPFFNANFAGKMARLYNLKALDVDLQELDLTVDRRRPRVYKGYRGGFVSIWKGVEE